MKSSKLTNLRFLIVALLGLALLLTGGIGCDDDDDNIVYVYENNPPPVPQGVYSITGDGVVYLFWTPVDDVNYDFDYYVVYRSLDPVSDYVEIATTTEASYFDDDGLQNGQTYYYAVSSVDFDGNLSDLSYEDVFDTPRPEGFNQALFDFRTFANSSGWDLSAYTSVAWNSLNCDFYLERDTLDAGLYYIHTANDLTDIQDMGWTSDFDEISYSPPADSGWSRLRWSEVILDHTYVIWTANDHYAKIRVTAIGDNYIIFDWGYQVDQSNRELKPRVPGDGA